MSHNPALRELEGAGTPTRVRIVASDPLVSDALRGALADVPGIEITVDPARTHVVLWDAGADPPSCSELQSAAAHAAHVLALARDEAHALALLAAGARGAVLREAGAPRLAAAAVAVRHGLCVLDAELAAPWVATSPADPEPEAGLTAREREVLALLGLGLSNKAIARRLEVSIHTAKFHVNSILAKLNADSRTAAVAAAVRRGLLHL